MGDHDPFIYTVMLIVGVNNGAHSVIPDLYRAIVQRGKEPWSLGMETEPFDTGCLDVKLGQHQPPRKLPCCNCRGIKMREKQKK